MAYEHDKEQITYIGTTNFRNTNIRFGIKDTDRLGHIYCIGKTGVGKSTLLQNMALQDIQNGKGLAVIDPHGDVAEYLMSRIPESRKRDVIYINPVDLDHPVAFNPLHRVKAEHHHLVVSGLVATFKKIWSESWGPRLEHILRFCLHTLLEYPDATLLDIQPLLTDADFRQHVLLYIRNPFTLAFWQNEYNGYSPRLRAEAIAPILNKVGLFQTSIPLRNMVGQKKRDFRMQQVLDLGKILIVNLSKGKIGEDASSLLGSMLVSAIQNAALYRAHKPTHTRTPFFLYIDECHSFITMSFVDILAEARKYGLGIFMANQFLGQLNEGIQSALIGNVGTLICFRIGNEDAGRLAMEFYPDFEAQDLLKLPRSTVYIKLMINGATSQPFSATCHQSSY
ncbi:MAG: type IV secretion system DNA-binding domain-containing protein [Bacteroidetes bacterium]|nr:type IV secretion system DNA-binding domain-containing protein [Bacteroidota bacterium]